MRSTSSFWTQDTGTWTISSGKVKTTNQGAGILLASPDVCVANYSLKVTVPVDQGDSYAGLVIAHDGDDTFYAVVFNSTFGLKLFHVVDGSWGSSLKEVSYSIGPFGTVTYLGRRHLPVSVVRGRRVARSLRKQRVGRDPTHRSEMNGPRTPTSFARRPTGRPCGDEAFVHKIESQTERNLTNNKPGPRPKNRQKHQR